MALANNRRYKLHWRARKAGCRVDARKRIVYICFASFVDVTQNNRWVKELLTNRYVAQSEIN